MKCLICGKELKEEEFVVFTNGNKVCKCHVQEFAKGITKEEDKHEDLKDIIVKKSVEKIIEMMIEKSLKQNFDVNNFENFSESVCQMLIGLEQTDEYNKIIFETKQQMDFCNEVNFEEIKYDSACFQYHFQEKLKKINEQMLDKPEFKIVHSTFLNMLPKNKEEIDFIFEDEGFEYKITPILLIVKHLWRFFPEVSAEKMFATVLKWSDSDYLREKIDKNVGKYRFLIEVLKKSGPLKGNEILDYNWIENFVKDIQDGYN